MKLLTGGDGRTMSAMAEALAIRPPTASKMIARLSAQGLVERRASQEDARIVSVYLTDEGRRRATALDAIAAKTEDELLDGLDNKDRRRLRKLLRKISKNLMVVEDAADAPDEEEPDED